MSEWIGEQVVEWTARGAVVCYVARLAADASLAPGARRTRIVRGVWTAGCVIFVLHVAAAFHFVHGWSHQSAFEHTAGATAAVTGLDWGGGLYFNYAFTAIWVADAARMWLTGRPDRTAWWIWSVHAFFGFMVVNATVVFGPDYWRWVAPAVIAGLVILRAWPRDSGRR